jgi:hypothetical protein
MTELSDALSPCARSQCFFESSVGSLAKFGMDSDGKVKELITDEYFRQAQPCEEGGQVLSWTGTPSATLPPCTVGNHRLTIEQFKKVYQLVGDETWTHPETEEVFSSIEFTNGKADQDQTLAMVRQSDASRSPLPPLDAPILFVAHDVARPSARSMHVPPYASRVIMLAVRRI